MTSSNGTLCLLSSTLQCESTTSKPQHVLWDQKNREIERGEAGGVTGTGRVFENPPLLFVSSVIVDCDKLGLSYLKPPIGQMVHPAGKG